MPISHFKENAILWDKRLKDNSNKAKTKKAMAPLIARFGNTQPPRGLKEKTSRWHSLRSSVLKYMKKWKEDPEYEEKWTFCERLPSFFLMQYRKARGSCLWLAQISVLLQGHVAQSYTRWSWRLAQSSVAATWPMKFNKMNSVRHVAGANLAQTTCCASEKLPAHTRGCVAATCPWNTSRPNFFKSVPTLQFGPCYMFLLHSPATCPLSVYLSPLQFAAACSCNMSPPVGWP